MTKKKIRLIVTTIVALMTLTIMCTAVSSAASKKTYRLPVKIKTQDSEVMKITYKGNIVKYSFPGNGWQKFTYKGKNKYKLKSTLYWIKDSATVRTKSGHVVSLKGKDDEGKYSIKYTYKKGKVRKFIKNATLTDNDDYKRSKNVTTIKTDKHGNVKKAIVKIKWTKHNGKVTKELHKDVYRNKYKGKYLTKSAVTFYGRAGRRWSPEWATTRKITYKEMKLTKKQYKKYKPIIEYLIRDYSTLY